MSSSGQSRATAITVPTTSGELTTASELTTAQEDLLLANNHFERIGRRQKIHQYAVHQHLKLMSKDSLALVISTFEILNRAEMQTPPPLLAGGVPFDPKAAIARGHALAFGEGTTEAEHAWAYGYTYTDGEDTGRVSDNDPRSVVDEAEEAFKNVEALAHRLRARHKAQCAS
ncbi:hypothetical protein C8F04DRAFT_1250000 [Mycena alexandri]|uniref:Uncharacterized protein n=1 Tax=Mycena alexandri TaxID=1745969 RepID=A0AAD6TFJ7_9AGAR|nr:hypothetical protein C8F04DRAFT_1250000 [Mycena alexandri]